MIHADEPKVETRNLARETRGIRFAPNWVLLRVRRSLAGCSPETAGKVRVYAGPVGRGSNAKKHCWPRRLRSDRDGR